MIIIAAMTEKKIIGKGNELPWNIPEDMHNFRELTLGNTCIMGLKTYESIGKALPNRNNIILSLKPVEIPGVDVCTTIPEAIEKAESYGNDIFICGGASIYKQFLPLADTMYISWIKEDYEGDVFFPEWDENEWEEANREDMGPFEFVVYNKR
ncbi:MAG: dihydrofolate reductase [Nanoarchaeota archaeon]|nr:dihydrofolate reductase [Nanoarchaeota archaeon]